MWWKESINSQNGSVLPVLSVQPANEDVEWWLWESKYVEHHRGEVVSDL
jgi:hypothetical protein